MINSQMYVKCLYLPYPITVIKCRTISLNFYFREIKMYLINWFALSRTRMTLMFTNFFTSKNPNHERELLCVQVSILCQYPDLFLKCGLANSSRKLLTHENTQTFDVWHPSHQSNQQKIYQIPSCRNSSLLYCSCLISFQKE